MTGRTHTNVVEMPISRLPLWERLGRSRGLYGFHVEVTARCNNNCRHCYINIPANDVRAREQELSVPEIARLADEAAGMGALWCVIGGGEPLLRPDFPEIYLALKQRGLLVSVFTNATLVTDAHVRLFKRYPPRDIEITVYGVTPETYERVTRIPGSFRAFERGMERLVSAGIPLALKAMALRSNAQEMPQIAEYCRKKSHVPFRFDPFLHLRFDRDPDRNQDILAERLTPDELVALEMSDPARVAAMLKRFDPVVKGEFSPSDTDCIFRCGAGEGSFDISPAGVIRPCASLWHPDFLYDWRQGTVSDAWRRFYPRILKRISTRKEFHEKCRRCRVINLCMWCPANAYLEVGEMDSPVDFFCRVAEARLAALKNAKKSAKKA